MTIEKKRSILQKLVDGFREVEHTCGPGKRWLEECAVELSVEYPELANTLMDLLATGERLGMHIIRHNSAHPDEIFMEVAQRELAYWI